MFVYMKDYLLYQKYSQYINNIYIPSRGLTEKLFLSKIIICDLHNKYIWNLMKNTSKIDWKNGIYHIYYYRRD